MTLERGLTKRSACGARHVLFGTRWRGSCLICNPAQVAVRGKLFPPGSRWARNAFSLEGQTMAPIVSIKELNKTYEGGFEALKSVSLDIEEGSHHYGQ